MCHENSLETWFANAQEYNPRLRNWKMVYCDLGYDARPPQSLNRVQASITDWLQNHNSPDLFTSEFHFLKDRKSNIYTDHWSRPKEANDYTNVSEVKMVSEAALESEEYCTSDEEESGFDYDSEDILDKNKVPKVKMNKI